MRLYVERQDDFPKWTAELIERLGHKGLTIAFAESLTAGLAASSAARVPGASKVLRGGVVTYTNDVKASLLDVDLAHANEVEGVSEEVARRMASGVRGLLGSDVGVSFTGFASTDAIHEQRAWVGFATGSGTVAFEVHPLYPMGRNHFRESLVYSAFRYLLDEILKDT